MLSPGAFRKLIANIQIYPDEYVPSCMDSGTSRLPDPEVPYDGDLLYWSARMGRHPELAPQVARLLKR